MYYSNRVNPYNYNMRNINYRSNPYQNNSRLIGGGGFLLPFSLGFISSPLIFGATRPRPPYAIGPGYPIGPPGSYFPYY